MRVSHFSIFFCLSLRHFFFEALLQHRKPVEIDYITLLISSIYYRLEEVFNTCTQWQYYKQSVIKQRSNVLNCCCINIPVSSNSTTSKTCAAALTHKNAPTYKKNCSTCFWKKKSNHTNGDSLDKRGVTELEWETKKKNCCLIKHLSFGYGQC